MADKNDFPPEEIWDEYVWERFLQQQDRNTEKYFQLLEKYLDDPDRDAIIAEEMGWDVFASGYGTDSIGGILLVGLGGGLGLQLARKWQAQQGERSDAKDEPSSKKDNE